MRWAAAVSEWNKGQPFRDDLYAIPKKGGDFYDEIRDIMGIKTREPKIDGGVKIDAPIISNPPVEKQMEIPVTRADKAYAKIRRELVKEREHDFYKIEKPSGEIVYYKHHGKQYITIGSQMPGEPIKSRKHMTWKGDGAPGEKVIANDELYSKLLSHSMTLTGEIFRANLYLDFGTSLYKPKNRN